MQHFFFGDEDDVAALSSGLAHEIAAFEKSGEADDVDGTWLHREKV